MSFQRNDAIARANLHSGVQALAQGAGGIFFLVFLLRAGVSVPVTLAAQAAIFAGRLAVRPILLPLARRLGLKPLVIAGTLGVACQYPLLAEVHGVDAALLLLCIVTAMGEVCYWLAYNAWFAATGDAEQRGRQIGAREALVAVAGVIGPILGAGSLIAAGPRWTFAAVGLVQALAAVPLLGVPNVRIAAEAPDAFRAARPAMFVLMADGWFDGIFFFVWPIALFVTLGESIAAFGGAMALAGLVGAVCGPVLGRHIDAGHGRRVVLMAYALAGAIVLLRGASLGSPWLAVIANASGALLMPLLSPVLGTVTYNLAKASPCPLRFHMATEAGWDVGGVLACLSAAGLVALGAPLSFALLLGIPGVAAGAFLLRRQYPRTGAAILLAVGGGR
jgi:hypothetical protein